MDIDVWRNGINLYIENALQLNEDGKVLMQNKSFGHACFSFITALEELGVAYYIMDHFNAPQPAKLKNFLNHVKKLSLSSFKITPYLTRDQNTLIEYLKLTEQYLLSQNNSKEKKKTEKEIIALGNELRKINSLKYLRNRGLYIELNRSKKAFQTPKELQQGYAYILSLIISGILPLIQAERDQIFKFGTENKKYREYELIFIQAMTKSMELNKILNLRSLDMLHDLKEIDPEESDFLEDLLLNPEKISLNNLDLMTNLLKILYKETARTFSDIINKKEFKEQFEYSMSRLEHYSSEIYKLILDFSEIFKEINANSFHLKNYPHVIQNFKIFLKFYFRKKK